jgi:predicted nucleic acid-binding protein
LSGYLLDTNVVSELRRPRPERRVVAFVTDTPGDQLFLSVVTIAELRFGIESLVDSEQRSLIATWLDQRIRPLFADRIVALDESILVRWRTLQEAGNKRGQTFSTPDMLIAATAIERGFTVVSRDVRPFERTGVPIHNPWTA